MLSCLSSFPLCSFSCHCKCNHLPHSFCHFSIPNQSSETLHTSLSALASFLLNIFNAFCPLSNNVAPSTIRCLFGFTTSSANNAGTIVGCRCSRKSSFCCSHHINDQHHTYHLNQTHIFIKMRPNPHNLNSRFPIRLVLDLQCVLRRFVLGCIFHDHWQ